MKELLKQIIVENHEFVKNIKVFHRDILFPVNGNFVLIGARRAGKSFALFQLIQQKLSEGTQLSEILYINFEDERLMEMKIGQLNLLLETHQELFNCKPLLFLDEIQNIDGWEKFARRLADQQYKVFITGSNARMLSREIATTLGGRFLVLEIYPFSFIEFLKVNQCNPETNWQYSSQRFEIRRLFESYFREGGFPEIIQYTEKKLWLQNLFNKILFGDIISRYQIRNDFALKLTIKKLAESVHDEISFNRIKHVVQAVGVKTGTATIIEYIGYLTESFLVFSIKNYLSKTSEKEAAGKYYFIDNGILSLFLMKGNTILLENLVANRLYRKYKEELFYLRKNYEVDFYIASEKMMVQVAYDVNNPETEARELKAMQSFSGHVEMDQMMVITLDTEKTITLGDNSVFFIPVWKWLLEN